MCMSALVMLVTMTTAVNAHCPEGGECFSREDARECAEAGQNAEQLLAPYKRHIKMLENELEGCDQLDADLQKCRGQLQECRKQVIDRGKTVKHLDRETARKTQQLAQAPDEGELVLWTGLGSAVSMAIACPTMARDIYDVGVCVSVPPAVTFLHWLGQKVF